MLEKVVMIHYLHYVDGTVKFERKGKDKKQVSVIPVEETTVNE